MAKRKLKDKLIDREDIVDTLVKVRGSVNAYVSNYGDIYIDFGNNKFLKKKQAIVRKLCFVGLVVFS